MFKKLFTLIVCLAGALCANAQFLDGFERFMDKVTGNESESPAPKSYTGKSYGANPGVAMMCAQPFIKNGTAYFLLTFEAADSVNNLTISATNPDAKISMNNPEIPDSLATFVVSQPYKPLGKSHEKSDTKNQMVQIGTPSASFSIPAGEMIDIMLVVDDFPKKVKAVERLDIMLTQSLPDSPVRYFGFTIDNLKIKR